MVTNNQAEYEVVLWGIQLLHEVKAKAIEIFGDSLLIINQLIGLYECKEETLKGYYDECQKLLKEFLHISFQHIPRAQNQEANRLAQSASGYRMFQDVLSSETSSDDWRVKIADYLRDSSRKVTRKLRYKSAKYILLDDQLYYKTVDGGIAQVLEPRRS